MDVVRKYTDFLNQGFNLPRAGLTSATFMYDVLHVLVNNGNACARSNFYSESFGVSGGYVEEEYVENMPQGPPEWYGFFANLLYGCKTVASSNGVSVVLGEPGDWFPRLYQGLPEPPFYHEASITQNSANVTPGAWTHCGAEGKTNFSWIVLQMSDSPDQLLFAWDTLLTTDPEAWSLYWSPGGLFTGGTPKNKPTASDQVCMPLQKLAHPGAYCISYQTNYWSCIPKKRTILALIDDKVQYFLSLENILGSLCVPTGTYDKILCSSSYENGTVYAELSYANKSSNTHNHHTALCDGSWLAWAAYRTLPGDATRETCASAKASWVDGFAYAEAIALTLENGNTGIAGYMFDRWWGPDATQGRQYRAMYVNALLEEWGDGRVIDESKATAQVGDIVFVCTWASWTSLLQGPANAYGATPEAAEAASTPMLIHMKQLQLIEFPWFSTTTDNYDRQKPAFDGIRSAVMTFDLNIDPKPFVTIVLWPGTDRDDAQEDLMYEYAKSFYPGDYYEHVSIIAYTSATTAVASGLAFNKTYYFSARCENTLEKYTYSPNIIAITTPPDPSIDVTPPVFVGDVRAVALDENTVRVTWDPGTDDMTAQEALVYEVHCGATTNAAFTVVGSPPAGTTSLVVSNLQAGKTYYFRVRCIDEWRNTTESAGEWGVTLPSETLSLPPGGSRLAPFLPSPELTWTLLKIATNTDTRYTGDFYSSGDPSIRADVRAHCDLVQGALVVGLVTVLTAGTVGNTLDCIVSNATDADPNHFNLAVTDGGSTDTFTNINFSAVGDHTVVNCVGKLLTFSVVFVAHGRPDNATLDCVGGLDSSYKGAAYNNRDATAGERMNAHIRCLLFTGYTVLRSSIHGIMSTVAPMNNQWPDLWTTTSNPDADYTLHSLSRDYPIGNWILLLCPDGASQLCIVITNADTANARFWWSPAGLFGGDNPLYPEYRPTAADEVDVDGTDESLKPITIFYGLRGVRGSEITSRVLATWSPAAGEEQIIRMLNFEWFVTDIPSAVYTNNVCFVESYGGYYHTQLTKTNGRTKILMPDRKQAGLCMSGIQTTQYWGSQNTSDNNGTLDGAYRLEPIYVSTNYEMQQFFGYLPDLYWADAVELSQLTKTYSFGGIWKKLGHLVLPPVTPDGGMTLEPIPFTYAANVSDLVGYVVAVRPPGKSALDVAPPVFAGITEATATGEDTVHVVWAAGTDGVSDPEDLTYQVHYSTSPGDAFEVKLAVTGETSCDVTWLQCATQYYFRVRCADEAGNYDLNSVELNATTLGLPPDVTAATVTVESPVPPARITPRTPIVIRVTDARGIRRMFFYALYPGNTGIPKEVIFDGDSVDLLHYSTTVVETLEPDKDYRITIRRTGGWPYPPRILSKVIDTSGNEIS
jgi:hypothetical protein